MHNRRFARWMIGLVIASLAPGCGGSGGGGGGGGGEVPGDPVTTLLVADLLGSLQTIPVDPDAHAAAVVEVRSDGQVRFSVTGQAAWIDTVSGLHVHEGIAGVDGPIVVDFWQGGVAFDPVTRTAEGTTSIPEALAVQLQSDPAGFYVNVHTAAAPAGVARGQLAPFTPVEWHATLRGEEEVPLPGVLGRGGAALLVQADLTVDYVIAMRNPDVALLALGHVHEGLPSIAGPVVFDLEVGAATQDPVLGTLSGTVPLGLSALSRVLEDPARFYVNVHTAADPGGVARGQLATGPVGMWAALRGDDEVTVVDPSARGGATLELNTFDSGRMILSVPPPQDIALVQLAHVHEGPVGIDGPVRIDLLSGADFAVSPGSSSSEGEIAYDQVLYARMLANPPGFYVNIHTAAAPGGLARGQLTQEPITLTAVMSGPEVVPPADPSWSGKLTLLLTAVHACEFSLEMSTPPATEVSALHVHDGLPGLVGPALIDLFNGTKQVALESITGETTFSGRTFARLVAGPTFFYADAHGLPAPEGLARGQFGLLTDDVPPEDLTYATPVVYTQGTAIGPNLPSSLGGAVTLYEVSPALPAGLALNPVTGAIAGTPTAVTAAADYTVTASNEAGSTQAVVNITVTVSAPAGLAYTSPVTYVAGEAITPNAPTSTGGTVDSYGVSPSLPNGLTLDTATGIVSGTPTDPVAEADYVITATNVAGDAQATVRITVTQGLQPPSGLSYTSPVSYPTGYAITANTPTVGGGTVASWAIDPALPAGLTFSTTTGTISGTPTVVTSQGNYTVTATNAAGNTQATVTVTVVLGAPTALSYSNDPGIGYVQGNTFTTMSPSVSGGAVASWSIAGTLPAGLQFDTTTGVISGAPTATSNFAGYVVTATNAAGSTQHTVFIVVY